MNFLTQGTLTTKTFWLGVILVGVSLIGLLPFFGWGFNAEALFAGIALITVRDAIEKQDIDKLDPTLDRIFGDVSSARIQEVLIALLVSQGVPEEEAVAQAAEMTDKLAKKAKVK